MKILVVSHNAFSDSSNNGKTLESIFSTFDKNCISQVFFSENENPDWNFCDSYYKITDIDVLKLTVGFESSDGILNVKKKDEYLPAKRKVFFKFCKSIFVKFSLCRDFIWFLGGWKKSGLLKWVEDINPDLIFFLGGNLIFSHQIAISLSDMLNKPLVSYFTDDYVIYPKRDSLHDKVLKFLLNKAYSKTIRKSSGCYVIGELMAEEYGRKFNKKFNCLMNSVPHSEINKKNWNDEKKVLRLAYFGGLHLNRWKMLCRLARCSKNIRIYVYSGSEFSAEIRREFLESGVEYMGSVKPHEIKSVMVSYDALLHVESDDPVNRALTKLSVSTKIPEYLISGIPLIGFGPSEVASMRLLQEKKVGIFIDSENESSDIENKLERIIKNYKNLNEISKNAYDYAVLNFIDRNVSMRVKFDFEKLTK